jgi:hypothetical protein
MDGYGDCGSELNVRTILIATINERSDWRLTAQPIQIIGGPVGNEIQIVTEPTFEQYLTLNRRAASRQLRFLKPFAVLGIVCYALSPFFPTEERVSVARMYLSYLPALILPAIVFVLLPLSVFSNAKRQWRSMPVLSEPKTFTFSDAGVTIAARSVQSSLAWHLLARAESFGSLVAIFSATPRLAALWFDEATLDPMVAAQVKTLLRHNIRDCRRLSGSTGTATANPG